MIVFKGLKKGSRADTFELNRCVPKTSALIPQPSDKQILCFLIMLSPLAFLVARVTVGQLIPVRQPQDIRPLRK